MYTFKELSIKVFITVMIIFATNLSAVDLKKQMVNCNTGDAKSCSTVALSYYFGLKVKQDFFKAYKFYQKACDGDHSVACGWLGDMYLSGQGVMSKNSFQAAKLHKKACDLGHMDSCAKLGTMYQAGNGVRQSYDKGLEYQKKSCDGKSMVGCTILGITYMEGKGVPQDYKKAKELFGLACDGGFEPGCGRFSILNKNGY